ncbi:10857_t:CDS:2 [Acaulospora colombiana]|uniref:10857_t:CDS:1 n=1 Tax=Acaulospora colombiana TaxID=27376 RepID=A0ACA9NFL7_9GLOM|nr:10857_t:CDS:2 [Acaulospora colombiana]
MSVSPPNRNKSVSRCHVCPEQTVKQDRLPKKAKTFWSSKIFTHGSSPATILQKVQSLGSSEDFESAVEARERTREGEEVEEESGKSGLKYGFINVINSTLSPTHRSFHASNRNFRPSLGLDSNIKIDPDDPIVTKIRSDPVILKSINEFAALLKNKGVDLSSGQMPSFMQMAKLAGDKEVSEKLNVLNTQFRQAGITFDAETAQKFMSTQNKHVIEATKSSAASDGPQESRSKITTKGLEEAASKKETHGLMEKIRSWWEGTKQA